MTLTEIGRLGHWVDLSKLNKDSIIVDAGTCTGEFIEEIRKLVNCKIIAIEPDPENFKTLENKHFENVGLHNNALVGNDEENFTIFYSYPQKELGNMFNAYPGSNYKFTAKTLKLSTLALPKIDYLKLDIEGEEQSLFEDATEKDFEPIQQISMELHANTDKNFIIKKLQDNGFYVEEKPRNEIYATKSTAWKHKYGESLLAVQMSDSNAKDYEQIWNIDWFKENVFKYIKKGESVLDVGCGNGRMATIFTDYFKNIAGIDVFSYGDNAYKYYNKLITSDFENYEFNEKFDCICFFASLYQMRDKVAAVKKAKELLNPGGQIVVMDGSQRQTTHLVVEGGYSYNLEVICDTIGFSCKKVEEKDNVFVKICEQQ